jgi:hypothetical protein
VDNRAQFIVSTNVDKRFMGHVAKFNCIIHIFDSGCK